MLLFSPKTSESEVEVKSLSHVRPSATYGPQPARLLHHRIFQARVLECGAIAFSEPKQIFYPLLRAGKGTC